MCLFIISFLHLILIEIFMTLITNTNLVNKPYNSENHSVLSESVSPVSSLYEEIFDIPGISESVPNVTSPINSVATANFDEYQQNPNFFSVNESEENLMQIDSNEQYRLKFYEGGIWKKVYVIKNTNAVVKVHKHDDNLLNIRNEYLAFKLSQQLGLNVVPYVEILNCERFENNSSLENCPGLASILTKKFPNKGLILQRFIDVLDHKPIDSTELDDELPIDDMNAHQVLFFNLLVGRDDPKRENSAIDNNTGRIWEIDNDRIISRIHKCRLNFHWLHNENAYVSPISNSLINHILNLEFPKKLDHIISERIFQIVHDNLTMLKSAIQSAQKNQTEVTFANITLYLPTLYSGEDNILPLE